MAKGSLKKADGGLETFIAEDAIIDRILQRKGKRRPLARAVDLRGVLREILLKANEFVPSDSGSILLDDPLLKWGEGHQGKLYFMDSGRWFFGFCDAISCGQAIAAEDGEFRKSRFK